MESKERFQNELEFKTLKQLIIIALNKEIKAKIALLKSELINKILEYEISERNK